MQLTPQTTLLQDEKILLEAIEARNQKRLAEIWQVVQDQPNQRQAVLAFINEINDKEKVEWILNEVIVHSPVRSQHNITLSQMHLFSRMATEKIGGYIGLEKVMIKLGDNCFEPDLCFFRPVVSKCFKLNQTIFPVPDFIVEVLSPSTRNQDMGVKRQLYCQYGVKEYWMVDAKAELVYQNILSGGIYEQTVYNAKMMLKGKVIKALKLPVAALFDASHPFKTWVSSAIHAEVELALEASIALLDEKDKALQDKDRTIEDKNKTIEAKDKVLQDKDKTIEAKDEALQDKDETIEAKNEALQDKDKIIAKLRAQLNDKT